MAHDFNNLLTVIVGYTELMLPDTREGDPMRAPLLDVHAAALRAAALTRQLLAFSRKQILQPRVLDLNALITESTNMLRRLLGEHLNLVLSLDRNLARVKADPGQLDQVIVNLAVNARDAMSQAGTLTIETHNVLSTAHGIIEQSGGWITVSSEPGGGSRFHIYLRRVDMPTAEAVERLVEVGGHRGTATVLVVEDAGCLETAVTGKVCPFALAFSLQAAFLSGLPRQDLQVLVLPHSVSHSPKLSSRRRITTASTCPLVGLDIVGVGLSLV